MIGKSFAVTFGSLLVSLSAFAYSPPPVESKSGMVVSEHYLASQVGAKILASGGNAIDAAVAVGYALAVVDPCCGNIGGGGFMTLHLADGRDLFLNFRERAPLAATPTMFLDASGAVIPKLSITGYKAVGVPGSVLGLETARERYGTMSREKLMQPAIEFADKGFVLGRNETDLLDENTDRFKADPDSAAIFLKDGRRFEPGERLVQKDLARSLKLISAKGSDAFYKGPIAAEIVAASNAHGGILTKEDFAQYTVQELKPVHCTYRGYDVISAPPPSSGGVTLCEILNIVEGYDLASLGYHSAAGMHVLVEAMRRAYVDRNNLLGDPDFINNPIDRLTSKEYADKLRATIGEKATPSKNLGPGGELHEGQQTTHYSVVDKAGNAVSVTYTLNAYFGASVTAGKTGIVLNDEMDDFTSKPGAPNMFGLVQGEANAIAPGKRPLSSMSPTILLKDGKIAMVVGSPGGSRIITAVLGVILGVVDYKMTVQEAVDAPRVHHQWLPDVVLTEPFALSADTIAAMQALGYTVKVGERGSHWSSAQVIALSPADPAASTAAGFPRPATLYGAADPRHAAGTAVGN
jgi:gamma-glutamyltranspeptidase/glutathione hydrolase